MKSPSKKLLTFLILAFILLGAFSPMFAGVAEAQTISLAGALGPVGFLFSSSFYSNIAEVFLTIGAFLLSTSGIFFDYVIDHTIVKMSENLATGSGGIGDGINTVWSTLRDLANMVFIFVLLWAAIQLILGLSSEIGKTIRNIIIVGLLINFSLFFTKVVIDASNIASIGFLNSINASAQAAPPVKIAGGYTLDKSYSSLIVGAVKIQSFFSPDGLGTPTAKVEGKNLNILLTGLMGFVLMLVLAIVLLVASVLFVTRYILLIFILILSPLALVGYALPALSGKKTEWWNALKNQAFFAPIFLLLLWVAFKLILTPGFIAPELIQGQSFATIGIKAPDTMGLLLNYVLAVGMIVGALILSKKMASKTAGFTAISGGIGGVVGGAAVGGLAIAGRNTMGRYANKVASDEDLKARAARGDIGARMKLATARGVAKSSFDARAVKGADSLTGGILGKSAGKGGFSTAVEEKAKAKAKYAKEVFGQTEAEKEGAARLKPAYETTKEKEEERIKNERTKAAEKVKADRDRHLDENISTPGSVIEGKLVDVLGSGSDRLAVADEINEIISALLNQLVSKAIGAVGNGLRSLSSPGSGNDGGIYANQLQNATLQDRVPMPANGQCPAGYAALSYNECGSNALIRRLADEAIAAQLAAQAAINATQQAGQGLPPPSTPFSPNLPPATPPPAPTPLVCPASPTLTLTPGVINVGGTSYVSLPAGWSIGITTSDDNDIARATGLTVTGIGRGSTFINAYNVTAPNGAAPCTVYGATINVK